MNTSSCEEYHSSSSADDCEGARRQLFAECKPDKVIQVYGRLCPHHNSPFTVEGNKLSTVDEVRGNTRILSFAFSKIFQADASQVEVFNTAIFPAVTRFIHGQDSLIFSYGTTSSGKTYTVQGTSENPGIIPQTIFTIFLNLENYIHPDPLHCPFFPNRLTALVPMDAQLMKARKEDIVLDIVENEEECEGDIDIANTSLSKVPLFKVLPVIVPNVKKIPVDKHCNYSIWVSYFEIYQEAIYDLLDSSSHDDVNKGFSTSKIGKRPSLPLCLDAKTKFYYIKDLKHYCVDNWMEAVNLFRFGRKRLSINSTLFNQTSSRSHSVFTIKLVATPVLKHHPPKISCMHICDLAGSERTKKTLTEGKRFREANNINLSIMVLNRCFEIIRGNQKKKTQSVVPYRDSKLTQIFQKSLVAGENIRMIVNLSQDPMLLEETRHVLRMSSIAQEVKLAAPKNYVPKKPRVSEFFFSERINGSSIDAISLSRIQGNYSSIGDTQIPSEITNVRPSETVQPEEGKYLTEIALQQEEINALRAKLREKEENIVSLEEEKKDMQDLLEKMKEEILLINAQTQEQILSQDNEIQNLKMKLAIYEEANTKKDDDTEEDRPEPKLSLFIPAHQPTEQARRAQPSMFRSTEVFCSTFQEKEDDTKKWTLRSRKEGTQFHKVSSEESSSDDDEDEFVPQVTRKAKAKNQAKAKGAGKGHLKPPEDSEVTPAGPSHPPQTMKKRGRRHLYNEECEGFEITDALMRCDIKEPVISPKSQLTRHRD